MACITREWHSTVLSQAEAFGEAWKQDYDEAMISWDSEDAAHYAVRLWDSINVTVQRWRERVSGGVQPYTETANKTAIKSLRKFLEGIKGLLRIAKYCESIGYQMKGIQELSVVVSDCQSMLDDWQPPRLATFALRDAVIPPEAMPILKEVLAKAITSPPLPTANVEIGDASFLKKKAC